MIEIGKTVISLDLFESKFYCDLSKCKGACCIEGDSGAPINPEEAEIIERLYPKFKEFLPDINNEEILRQGFSVIDQDGELVTPIIGNNECVYTYKDKKGITFCAIEKAFNEKQTGFRKPLSCFLFPVRITEYKRFDGINYEKLKICKSGRACGKSMNIPLWKFLKEPLIQKYGNDWYTEVENAAKLMETKSEE